MTTPAPSIDWWHGAAAGHRPARLKPTTSVSELLDVARSRLIEDELERRHIDGYRKRPIDDEFRPLAQVERRPEHDDVDWAALYGIRP